MRRAGCSLFQEEKTQTPVIAPTQFVPRGGGGGGGGGGG